MALVKTTGNSVTGSDGQGQFPATRHSNLIEESLNQATARAVELGQVDDLVQHDAFRRNIEFPYAGLLLVLLEGDGNSILIDILTCHSTAFQGVLSNVGGRCHGGMQTGRKLL